MGALLGVLIFTVLLFGGFIAVHFVNDCIKVYEDLDKN
jgi:hypothetical protein